MDNISPEEGAWLEAAMADPRNEYLLQTTARELRAEVEEVLGQLQLPPPEERSWRAKLRGYRFVDDVQHLREGAFLRAVPLAGDPDQLQLTPGALFCGLRRPAATDSQAVPSAATVADNDWLLVCRNVGSRRRFTLRAEEHLLFQRLTDQELVLLQALDVLRDLP